MSTSPAGSRIPPAVPPAGPAPDLEPSFATDPYGASRAWLAEWPWPPLRRIAAGHRLVGDPGLVRTVLRSTTTPFLAASASFARVDGWAPGTAVTRPLVAALGRHLDGVAAALSDGDLDDLVRAATRTPANWPHAGSLLLARLLAEPLLTGAPPDLIRRLVPSFALGDMRGSSEGRLARLRRTWHDSRATAALSRWAATVRAAPADGFQRALTDAFAADDEVAIALQSLVAAAARPAALPLAWTVLLDHGWHPGVPAGTVLPARPVTAPPGDRIREANRLWPAAAVLVREVAAPVRLGGTDLVPGELLYACVWALHRDPDRWETAEEYRPERWRRPPSRYGDAYLPYGTGPGACVAGRFVNDLGARVLAALDRAGPYDVEVLDDGPAFGALLKPPRFRLRPR